MHWPITIQQLLERFATRTIGADDEITNGSRELFGFTGDVPLARGLLDFINPVADPPLANLMVELIEMDGKCILVITIMPDPHLHETRRPLKTGDQTYYSEHVVFIRHSDSIRIASAKERSAIQELRRKRLTERNVPLTVFGTVLGGSIGAGFPVRLAEHTMPQIEHGKVVAGIMGTVLFGGIGFILSHALKSLVEIRMDWHGMNNFQKTAALFYIATLPIAIVVMYIGNPKNKK